MSHPALGLPPDNPSAGRPRAAARLRADRSGLADRALAASLAIDPGLGERHDATMLRLFLRDYQRHIEQLALALETGEDRWVAEHIVGVVPIMRRRHVSMDDFGVLWLGLRDASAATLPVDDGEAVTSIVDAGLKRLHRPAHLPGDRPRGRITGFIWKAAGIGGW